VSMSRSSSTAPRKRCSTWSLPPSCGRSGPSWPGPWPGSPSAASSWATPIHEFVRTPTGAQEIEWHITEHDRPHHAKLQAEDGLLGVVVVALHCRQEVAMLHRQMLYPSQTLPILIWLRCERVPHARRQARLHRDL